MWIADDKQYIIENGGNVANYLAQTAESAETGYLDFLNEEEIHEYETASPDRREDIRQQIINFIEENYDYEIGKEPIRINYCSLVDCLIKAIVQAHDFCWTGWRIPIYLDEETGLVSSGSWLSNNSWQPDAHELPVKVETWSMADWGYEGKLVNKTTPDNEEGNYTNDDIKAVVRECILDGFIERIKEIDDPDVEYIIIDTYPQEEGTLNEFENHFGKVEFSNIGDLFILSLFSIDEEMKNSPEFWVAQFTKDKWVYVIAANGSLKSSGKYVVRKTTI